MNDQGFTTKTVEVVFLVCMCVVLYLVTAFVWPAYASERQDMLSALPSRIQTTLTADLAAQRNPDGMMLMAGAYRRWLQETAQDGAPARYTQTGVGLGVNPAYAKGSLHGEWQPAVFFTLRLEYDLYRFFGTNAGLLSFPNADAKFGRHELEEREGSEEKAMGHRVLLQPTLYAQAGPILIMNQTDLAYYRFSGDGPYFLDWEYDTLVKDGDSVIANRTQCVVASWKGAGAAILYLGPYYEITHAVDADITRQRVGGQAYWVPADTFRGMSKPRIYSQVGVNIQDRNRQGEVYMAIGVGADFNL